MRLTAQSGGKKTSKDLTNKGIRCWYDKKYEEAISFFESAIYENPNNSTPYFQLGLVYRDTGRLDEALDMLLRSEDMYNRNNADSHELYLQKAAMRKLALSDVYLRMKRYDLSLAEAKKGKRLLLNRKELNKRKELSKGDRKRLVRLEKIIQDCELVLKK